MRRVLANRNARWYISGQSFSILGDSSLWLAVGIWVKELTHSSGEAALVFFFFGLSAVFSPFAGMLVDRVRRRPLLIVGNLASALLVLALLAVHGRGQVYVIYLVMVGYGLSSAVLGSGQSALLKTMLPSELLGDANGLLQTIQQGLRLVTPLIGAGLFVLVGGHVVAILDAGTFVVAAATLLRVHIVEERDDAATASHSTAEWWHEVTAGIRHIWTTIELRQVLIGTGVACLVIGFFEALVFAIVGVGLHRPPTFLGILLAFEGVGAVAGGPTAAPFMRRTSPGTMIGIGIAGMALGSVLVMPPELVPVCLGIVVFGFALPWVVVGLITVLQLRTPNELQGRVSSAADVAVMMPQTFSIALGAALVSIVNYRILLGVVAAVLAISAVYLLSRPEQRRREAIAATEVT